jgi:hypothetical protein
MAKTLQCEDSFEHVQIDQILHSYKCLCKEDVIFHQHLYNTTDSIKALSFLKDRKKIGNIKDITNFPLWLNRRMSRSSYNPKKHRKSYLWNMAKMKIQSVIGKNAGMLRSLFSQAKFAENIHTIFLHEDLLSYITFRQFHLTE